MFKRQPEENFIKITSMITPAFQTLLMILLVAEFAWKHFGSFGATFIFS
jgi:hypothetical protein